MRRPTTLMLSLVAASGLVLAACGGSDDDTASTDTSTESAIDDGGHAGEGHGESSPVAGGARRIEITADALAFDPEEITVTAGEDVAIVLTSEDMLHDFTVDDIEVHVAAAADETAEGGFRADEPGEYAYYCTVPGHRDAGMEGTLVVEPA